MEKVILNLLKKLEYNGYSAFIVGGYVRDKILGINSIDIDICTNCLPKDVIKIFNVSKKITDNYGSVTFKLKKYNIDITTYRKESDYVNHIPKNIQFEKYIKNDLVRRDFTINSILLNSNEEYIDYYNGIKDIEDRVIRCIGVVEDKLSEDPLRIMRAIRFMSIYNFILDDSIRDFIINNKYLISNISYYRKKEEVDKVLSSNNKINGLNIIKELGLCDVLEISFDKIKYCKDILGMYSQMNYSDSYPFTKLEKDIINKCRIIIKNGKIDNYSLYKYGLYINTIVGEILGYDYLTINKMYKSLPIKEKKDIKISVKSIVKLNNNCYNNINEIYSKLENTILSGKLKNRNRDIVKFLRK